eukprot:TRINITY_DN42620_c0_g1_i1.p1 TRINITY_DN42620_c0_g1~~TRINITY_DN42620_c0_g1_i1.p1  ORF type:complete len:454 (+),score=65.45 TRINITY_DN42620_c0_g1_i1:44-1405(+)
MDFVLKGFQDVQTGFNDLRSALMPDSSPTGKVVRAGYSHSGGLGASHSLPAETDGSSKQEDFATIWKAFCKTNPRLQNPKTLPSLMRRGIPNEFRQEVWSHCLGLQILSESETCQISGSQRREGRIEVAEQKDLRHEVLRERDGARDEKENIKDAGNKEADDKCSESTEAGREESDQGGHNGELADSTDDDVKRDPATGCPQTLLDVIEADVARTFPNHEGFKQIGGAEKLRRVLIDLALQDSELGYCQSLNFIAAIFLMTLQNELSARMAAEKLLVKLGTRCWYTDGMKQLRADTLVLEDMIRERLPAVHSSLRNHKFDLIFVTSKWFMCLFASTLEEEVLRRVWDVLLGDGIEAVFRISLTLFAFQAKAITQIKSSDDLIFLMQDWHPDCSAEALLQKAYDPALVGSLSRAELARRRREAADKISSAETRDEMRKQHLWRGGVRPASILAR